MTEPKLPTFYGEDQESPHLLLLDEFFATGTFDLDPFFPDAVAQSGSFDLRDITQAMVSRLWDVLPLSILLVNEAGTITYVNPFCLNLLGKGRGLLGQPFTAVFPDHIDAGKLSRILDAVCSDRKPIVVEGSLEPEGKRIWTRIHLRFVAVQERKARPGLSGGSHRGKDRINADGEVQETGPGLSHRP